jgi:hypothetical protein
LSNDFHAFTCSHRKTFLSVNAPGLFVIDQPSVAPQQHVNAPVPVPRPRLRNLFDSKPFGPVITLVRSIAKGRACNANEPAGASFMGLKAFDQMNNKFSLGRRLQSFFAITS